MFGWLGGIGSWFGGRGTPVDLGADQIRHELISQPFGHSPLSLDPSGGETVEMREMYLDLYQKEGVVRAAINGLVDAVASADVTAEPADRANPASRDVAEFLMWSVDQSEGGWPTLITDTGLPALLFGHSLGEPKLQTRRHPTRGDQWALEHLRSLDTRFLRLQTDVFRNVVRVISTVRGMEPFDPEKVVLFTYRRVFHNPFGNPTMRAAYRDACLIEDAYKLWHYALKMYSDPYIVGKYTNPVHKGQLLEALKALRAGGVLVTSKEDDVQLLSLSAAVNFAAFEAKVRNHRENVFLAIRGSYLPFVEGVGGPSAHGDTEVGKLSSDTSEYLFSQSIARCLNKQLVPKLIYPNFGPDTPLPTLKLGGLNWDKIKNVGDTLEKVVKAFPGRLPISAKRVSQILGIPPSEGPDDELNVAPPPEGGPGGPGGGAPTPGTPPAVPPAAMPPGSATDGPAAAPASNFSADQAGHYATHFEANQHGHYPGTIHEEYGMSPGQFAALNGLRRREVGKGDGRRWVWVPRPKEEGTTKTFSAYDESLHPRDDHGRFVSAKDLRDAARDPAKAAALRATVTAPAERVKLDAAIPAARVIGGVEHANKVAGVTHDHGGPARTHAEEGHEHVEMIGRRLHALAEAGDTAGVFALDEKAKRIAAKHWAEAKGKALAQFAADHPDADADAGEVGAAFDKAAAAVVESYDRLGDAAYALARLRSGDDDDDRARQRAKAEYHAAKAGVKIAYTWAQKEVWDAVEEARDWLGGKEKGHKLGRYFFSAEADKTFSDAPTSPGAAELAVAMLDAYAAGDDALADALAELADDPDGLAEFIADVEAGTHGTPGKAAFAATLRTFAAGTKTFGWVSDPTPRSKGRATNTESGNHAYGKRAQQLLAAQGRQDRGEPEPAHPAREKAQELKAAREPGREKARAAWAKVTTAPHTMTADDLGALRDHLDTLTRDEVREQVKAIRGGGHGGKLKAELVEALTAHARETMTQSALARSQPLPVDPGRMAIAGLNRNRYKVVTADGEEVSPGKGYERFEDGKTVGYTAEQAAKVAAGVTADHADRRIAEHEKAAASPDLDDTQRDYHAAIADQLKDHREKVFPAGTGVVKDGPGAGRRVEMPGEEPAAPHDSHPAVAALHAAVDKSPGLSDAQRKTYKESASRVTERMPPAARDRLHENLKGGATFHADNRALAHAAVEAAARATGADPAELERAKAGIESGQVAYAGAYLPQTGEAFLNGDATGATTEAGRYAAPGGHAPAHHVHAHEYTHAIDGPDFAHSGSAGWQAAHAAEIDQGGNPLTDYARESPQEGFAEFGRLVYSGDHDLAEVEAAFPQAAAYFKGAGLWPDGAGGDKPVAEFPEAFDREKRADFGAAGHADVAKAPDPDLDMSPEAMNPGTGETRDEGRQRRQAARDKPQRRGGKGAAKPDPHLAPVLAAHAAAPEGSRIRDYLDAAVANASPATADGGLHDASNPPKSLTPEEGRRLRKELAAQHADAHATGALSPEDDAAFGRVMEGLGVKPLHETGETVPFDPETMDAASGISTGSPVTVTRRGWHGFRGDNSGPTDFQSNYRRATVEPVAAAKPRGRMEADDPGAAPPAPAAATPSAPHPVDAHAALYDRAATADKAEIDAAKASIAALPAKDRKALAARLEMFGNPSAADIHARILDRWESATRSKLAGRAAGTPKPDDDGPDDPYAGVSPEAKAAGDTHNLAPSATRALHTAARQHGLDPAEIAAAAVADKTAKTYTRPGKRAGTAAVTANYKPGDVDYDDIKRAAERLKAGGGAAPKPAAAKPPKAAAPAKPVAAPLHANGLPDVKPGAAQKPDDPAYQAAGKALLADDGFRKDLADAYNHQRLFVEHRDGMIPLDRVYHELAKRRPGVTVDQLHAAVDHLSRERGVEMHALNEIAKVPPDERIATISRNDRNYHFMRFPGGADAEKMKPAGEPPPPKAPAGSSPARTFAADTPPTHAGLCVHAADTGRVLLIQRAATAGDLAAGLWEFPGGKIEPGETPLQGAAREWTEEVGTPLPLGRLAGEWKSDNGVYAGHVWELPTQDGVDLETRTGDRGEAVRWRDPADLADNGIRPELKADTPKVLAALGKWQNAREFAAGGPPRPGLVPQTGDAAHPGHWVRPEKAGGGSSTTPAAGADARTSAPDHPAPPEEQTRAAVSEAVASADPAAAKNPGLMARLGDKAVTAAAKAHLALVRLTPAMHRTLEVMGAVFDTPEDFKKFGYSPGTSGAAGESAAGAGDPVKASLEVSAHVAATLAAKVIGAGLVHLRKATGVKLYADEAGELAAVLREAFAAVAGEFGLAAVPGVEVIAERVRAAGGN